MGAVVAARRPLSKNSGPPYLCSMSEVYAHLAAEHLAPYAERLVALRAVATEVEGTNTAQA